MGSEGRGEQLLKTDQDNGLVLRDGYARRPTSMPSASASLPFWRALATPECPGRIMLSNPAWRGTASAFTQRARQWLLQPDGDSLMNLAIFLDAHAVAGDAALLAQVRGGLMALATDNDALVARFAAVVEQFGVASSWWNRLLGLGDDARHINLKKAGIFPIVHGVRSPALARHVGATGTAERISALVADGTLDAALGQELVQSLHFLMGLRLQAGLMEIDLGRPVTGNVDPRHLSSLERDLLKGRTGGGQTFQGAAAPAPAAGLLPPGRSCAAPGCAAAWPTRPMRFLFDPPPPTNGWRWTVRPRA